MQALECSIKSNIVIIINKSYGPLRFWTRDQWIKSKVRELQVYTVLVNVKSGIHK